MKTERLFRSGKGRIHITGSTGLNIIPTYVPKKMNSLTQKRRCCR